MPTDKLYPFQWNWDSGFVSIGWGHYSLENAMSELACLFSGQWKNGMIPHIIFHSEKEKTYFPNFDFWKAEVNAGAPNKPKTSGITQPPVHGFVLEELLRQHPNDEKLLAFAKVLFPRIVDYHRFFYDYRDDGAKMYITFVVLSEINAAMRIYAKLATEKRFCLAIYN